MKFLSTFSSEGEYTEHKEEEEFKHDRLSAARKSSKIMVMGGNKTRQITMLYENQRWWIGQGFTSTLFNVERSAWSDLSGEMQMLKTDQMLLGKDWDWEDEWKVQGRDILRQFDDKEKFTFMKNPRPGVGFSQDIEGMYDEEGWQYAIDFTKTFNAKKSIDDFVRRRKWVRI